MHALTADEVNQQPHRLLEDAHRGQAHIVLLDGEPIMLTLPLGPAAGGAVERLALAITLYERALVSLGLATPLTIWTRNLSMSVRCLVADSSPLIALARLDLLALPNRIFGETLVTATVWQEVLRAPKPGAAPPWLRHITPVGCGRWRTRSRFHRSWQVPALMTVNALQLR